MISYILTKVIVKRLVTDFFQSHCSDGKIFCVFCRCAPGYTGNPRHPGGSCTRESGKNIGSLLNVDFDLLSICEFQRSPVYCIPDLRH